MTTAEFAGSCYQRCTDSWNVTPASYTTTATVESTEMWFLTQWQSKALNIGHRRGKEQLAILAD